MTTVENPEPTPVEPTPVSTVPSTADEARSALHVALDDVESAFGNLYGKVTTKVQALLSHLRGQAESLTEEADADVKTDVAEVTSDIKTVTVTGQNALGGGVNPNAVHPTGPVSNIPVQQDVTQQIPSTPAQG